MANYRTREGRVYSVLDHYFQTMPPGMSFSIQDIVDPLIQRFNHMYPAKAKKNNNRTWIDDALRTLIRIKKSPPFLKIGHGRYKLIRPLQISDREFLRRNYKETTHPGCSKKQKQIKKEIQTKKQEKQMKNDKTDQLKNLGSAETKYNYQNPNMSTLEVFPNQFSHRDYVTEFIFLEFTSLCPKTSQPDFAKITLQYIPDKMCIETKSLKLYFLQFRQHGAFMETITNTILEDCAEVCAPRWMKVVADFNARGGTLINVTAEHSPGLKRK